MSDIALVTGGSRNIGRAISDRLIVDGYEVVQFDILEPEAGMEAEFVRVDLADEGATAVALDELQDNHRVTRLVNNVGVVHAATLEEMKLDEFDRIIQINTRSAVQCMQAVLPGMREARFGRVLNLSSRSIIGMPTLSAYAASKAAIAGLTRTWAMEFAPDGITVNAVAPGPIDTDMLRSVNPPGSASDQLLRGTIPVGRLGEPDDIANAASYFLDAKSGFTTGQVLFVCGGMSIGRLG